ncbi:PREDICTED: probable pectinesterase/pectinesterase inhibitor 40 [Ipomoea nil]|uniref:probable pectinesterase/pectinesterase inhibitor 40 n=1 Tax=Ipomoea nil TaxID=35883 RepID=UPI000900FAAE|nr:PREDICTED: probable pectinesterase/pectinesterase inhibitor 40 [Ipomoea nil]
MFCRVGGWGALRNGDLTFWENLNKGFTLLQRNCHLVIILYKLVSYQLSHSLATYIYFPPVSSVWLSYHSTIDSEMQNLGRNPIMLVPVVLLAAFLSLTVFQSSAMNATTSDDIHQVAHSACDRSLYRDLCVSTLVKTPDLRAKSIPEIISATVNVTVSEITTAAANCSRIRRVVPDLGTMESRALYVCLELFSDTLADLRTVLDGLENSPAKRYADLQTLLSTAMTNQYTCLEGFPYSNKNVRPFIIKRVEQISRHVSNALSMLTKIKKEKNKPSALFGPSYSSSSFRQEHGEMKDGFPKWLSRRDRALLEAPTGKKKRKIKADVTVAKDGSGDFKSINAALSAAPDSSDTRYVIHIKAGSYYEYVDVDKKKTMIMFVGDGIGKTRIKGNRNVKDGWPTFRSATVAVVGTGFIAIGISFENSAGPEKHQAVALRADSDYSVFYDCRFVGYQDTLYVHSRRQFFRECDVYGTVDFIFGNSAVVFQKCNLYLRKPLPEQKNVITAQGRSDPHQNTGISILHCQVKAAADLIPVESDFKSYLGRPWQKYSRTVFMLSKIGSLIDPAGWLEWQGDFALKTLYYGEYKNKGPGADTSNRVTWAGYRIIKRAKVAKYFTAANLIDGGDWLPVTDPKIPYYPGLKKTKKKNSQR